jgi:hypothetical protein
MTLTGEIDILLAAQGSMSLFLPAGTRVDVPKRPSQ